MKLPRRSSLLLLAFALSGCVGQTLHSESNLMDSSYVRPLLERKPDRPEEVRAKAHIDLALAYIEIAQSEGARVETGGGRPEGERFGRGVFVAPAVLAGGARLRRAGTAGTAARRRPGHPGTARRARRRRHHRRGDSKCW